MRYSILFAIFLSGPSVAFAGPVVVDLDFSRLFHYRESIGDKTSDVYVPTKRIVSVRVTTPKSEDADQSSSVEILTNESEGEKSKGTEESVTKQTHRLVFNTPDVAKRVAENLLFVLALKDGEGYGQTEQAYLLGAGMGALLVNGYRLNWNNDIYPSLHAEFGEGPKVERMARHVVECNHDGRFIIAKCGVNELYPQSNDPSMQFVKFEHWIFDTAKPASSEGIHGPYSLEDFTHNRKWLGVKEETKLLKVSDFK